MGVEVFDLELTIIRGDGLAAKDTSLFGYKTKSDPYVEVVLCPQGPLQGEDTKILVGKTEPRMKTLQPRWDETFVTNIPVDKIKLEFAAFELKIWDFDKYKDDDPMGVIVIKIPNSIDETTTKWYRIPASSLDGDEATGRLECTLRTRKRALDPGEEVKAYQDPLIPEILRKDHKRNYFRTAKKVAKKTKKKLKKGKNDDDKDDAAAGPKEDQVELDLTITRARDLAPMDTNLFGFTAKSDPYIVVRMCPCPTGALQGGKKIYVGKTPTIMKTLDPIWKDQNKFSITLPLAHFSRHAFFELTIWDYDKSNEDDIMGVVPLPVNIERPPGPTTKWYKIPPLSAGAVGASGEVECVLDIKRGDRAAYTGRYEDEDVDVKASLQRRMGSQTSRRSSAMQGAAGPKRVEVIELELNVVRAKGLAAMDSNVVGLKSTSDPYIIVKLCPEGPAQPDETKIELGQTDVVFKTLDPTWKRKFDASLLKKDMTPYAAFELSIWDYDDANDDDLMGKLYVHIPTGKSGTTKKWYEVPASSGEDGKASGDVECILTTRKIQRFEGPAEAEDGLLNRPNYTDIEDPDPDSEEEEEGPQDFSEQNRIRFELDNSQEISPEAGGAVAGKRKDQISQAAAEKEVDTVGVAVTGESAAAEEENEDEEYERILTPAERIARNRKLRQWNSGEDKKRKARRKQSSAGGDSKTRTVSSPNSKRRSVKSKDKAKSRKKRGQREKKDSKQGSSSSVGAEEDFEVYIDIDEDDTPTTKETVDSDDDSFQGSCSTSTFEVDIDEEAPIDTDEDDTSAIVTADSCSTDEPSTPRSEEGKKATTNREEKKAAETESKDTNQESSSLGTQSKDTSAVEEEAVPKSKHENDGVELRADMFARSNATKQIESCDDDSNSESEEEGEAALDKDGIENLRKEVRRRRQKIISIYEKWSEVKSTKTTVDEEKRRMMPFRGFVI